MIDTTTAPPVELPRVASTPREFIQWLCGFAHPDALARWLAQHGITGVQAVSRDCPLAKLAQHSLDDDRIRIGTSALVKIDRTGMDTVTLAVLPLVAVEFVVTFDHGRYPQLVEGPVHKRWLTLLADDEPTPYCGPSAPYTPIFPTGKVFH